MNYAYTLDGVAVNPTGEWEIEYRRNKGQIFFRRHLTGELMFKGVDYDYLNSIVDNLVSFPGGCAEIDFIIYCNGAEFWTGKFQYPYSFTFDTDSCEAKGKPEVVDQYSCIMDKYEQEFRMQVIPGSNWIDGLFANAVAIGGDSVAVNTTNLWGVFEDLINGTTGFDNMDCDITCVSSFFNRDEFPGYAPGHYAGIYGTTNYVTPGYPNNELEMIYLVRNSELRWLGGAGGTRCDGYDIETITFKFFEDLFRERFNAYWYIDEDGYFRLEHISYFLPGFLYSDFGSQIDLTILMSGCNNFAQRRNKYKHLIEELFDQEKWSWQHYEGEEEDIAHNLDFQGVPIYYGATESDKSSCVPGEFKIKESATPQVHSDFKWVDDQFIATNYDCLGCPGFMIINLHSVLGVYGIASDTGAYTGLAVANGFCSTANLQANFFTWDRIFLTGTMNGGGAAPVTDFDSAIKKKLQDEIEFPLCCNDEFDPMKQITTGMGDGSISSAVQTKYSLKIQLLYD